MSPLHASCMMFFIIVKENSYPGCFWKLSPGPLHVGLCPEQTLWGCDHQFRVTLRGKGLWQAMTKEIDKQKQTINKIESFPCLCYTLASGCDHDKDVFESMAWCHHRVLFGVSLQFRVKYQRMSWFLMTIYTCHLQASPHRNVDSHQGWAWQQVILGQCHASWLLKGT